MPTRPSTTWVPKASVVAAQPARYSGVGTYAEIGLVGDRRPGWRGAPLLFFVKHLGWLNRTSGQTSMARRLTSDWWADPPRPVPFPSPHPRITNLDLSTTLTIHSSLVTGVSPIAPG